MIVDKDEVLAEFYNLCGEILLGKAQMASSSDFNLTDEQKKSKRIIKAMIDTGQSEIVRKEFSEITKSLSSEVIR